LSFDVDVDAGDTREAYKVTDPSHGAVTVATDGSFSYTAAGGFSGTDSFTYRVYDSDALYDTGLVTINVDGAAPLSTARTPAAGLTGRPRDTKPTIMFNELLLPSSVTASTFRIQDATTGTWLAATASYTAATKLATLSPSSLLPAGHRVKVYATSGVMDLAGNSFAGTSWTFTVTSDATRPTVVAKSPAPSATGVSRSTNIKAKFSEQVRSSTVTTSTVRLQDTATGSIVPASVVYDTGTRRAILDPSSRLAARRTYKVLVSSSIRDRAGNRLRATSWTFKTGG
jgi:hypothetical protein